MVQKVKIKNLPAATTAQLNDLIIVHNVSDDTTRKITKNDFLRGFSSGLESSDVILLVDSDYVQSRITLDGVGIDSATSILLANAEILSTVDSAYVQSRITLDGVGIDSATSILLANAEILSTVDSAYVQQRVTLDGVGIDSAAVIGLVDSAYVQARITLDGVGIDSAQATTLITTTVDSAYVQARQIIGGTGGIDSATSILLANAEILSTVDSAYVQSRVTLDGVGIDSADALGLITTTVDSAYVQSRVTLDGTGIDSAAVTTLVDSAYVSSRTDPLQVLYAVDSVNAGAVERNIVSRLDDIVSPEDFGAVGDGVTDDTLALQAMLDHVFATAVATDTTLQRGHVAIRFPARRAYKITDTLDFGGQINPSSGLQGGCQVNVDFANCELYPAADSSGVVHSALRLHGDTGRYYSLKIRYDEYCTQDQVFTHQPTGVLLCPPTATTPSTYSSSSYVTYDTIQVFGAYHGFELEPDTVSLFKARFIQCDAKQCISWGWKMRSEPKRGISTTTIWEQCHVAARLTSAVGGRARIQETTVATGGQTVFSYTQEFDTSADVIVRLNDVALTLNTNYTVDLVAQTITLTTGATAGDVIDIYGVYECYQTHVPDLTNKPGTGLNWRDYWYSRTDQSDASSQYPAWSESTTRYYEDGKGWDIYGMSSATLSNQCAIDGTNNREAGNGIRCLQFGLNISGGFHWELPKMVAPDTPLIEVSNASLHIDHLYIPGPVIAVPSTAGNNLFIGGSNSRLINIEEARVVAPIISRGNLVFVDAAGFGIVKTGTGIGDDQVINLPSADVHGAFDVQRKITHRPQWEQLGQNYGGSISTVTPVTSQSGTLFAHNVSSTGQFNLNLTQNPEIGSFYKALCYNTAGGNTADVVVSSSDGSVIVGPLVAKKGETLCAYKLGNSFWYTTIEYNQHYGDFVEVDALIVGQNYKIYSLGNTTQTEWNTIAGTTGVTYAVNDIITPVQQGPIGSTGRVGDVWIGDLKLENVTNTLPSASRYEGHVIRVSDDTSYGDVLAFSDGTDWLRANDLTPVNTSGVTFVDRTNNRFGINNTNPQQTVSIGPIGNSSADQLGTVGIKADANDKAIMIQQNGGLSQWEVGVDASGNLNFYNSGSTTPSISFFDTDSVAIAGTLSATNFKGNFDIDLALTLDDVTTNGNSTTNNIIVNQGEFGAVGSKVRLNSSATTGLIEFNSSSGVVRSNSSDIFFQSNGTTSHCEIGATYIRPATNDGISCGSSAKRFSEVFATNGTINTSDENYKQQITTLDSAELAVASKIKPLIRKYKMNSAVAEKGDAARWHIGVIAQDLITAFQEEGLDPFEYGILCFDEWWEKQETVDGIDYIRTYPTQEQAPADATYKSLYSVRYDELIAFVISVL